MERAKIKIIKGAYLRDQLAVKERGAESEEQRAATKERIKKFREKITNREQAVGFAISLLQEEIYGDPDIGVKELWEKVASTLIEAGLDSKEQNLFLKGIGTYVSHRKKIVEYRARYPSDKDLFEACFGRRPAGEIRVIVSPLSILFRCLDKRDYILAYHFQAVHGDEAALTDEQIQYASASKGAALSEVKESSLKDVIIVEKCTDIGRRYEEEKEYELTEGVEPFTLSFNKIEQDIQIFKKNGLEKIAELTVAARDVYGLPKELKFVNFNSVTGASNNFLIKREVVMRGNQKVERAKVFNMDSNETIVPGNADMRFKTEDGAIEYRIFIGNRSVILSAIRGSINILYDEAHIREGSHRATMIHENQHQLDKLFSRVKVQLSIVNYIESMGWDEKVGQNIGKLIIEQALRNDRESFFDDWARNEILAYCEGEQPLKDILEILTKSDLYNYHKRHETWIKESVTRYKKIIPEYIAKVYRNGGFKKSGIPVLTQEDFDHAEKLIFDTEYKKNIVLWLNAIRLLEDKGWDRYDIVDLLYQAPTSAWPGMARRALVVSR